MRKLVLLGSWWHVMYVGGVLFFGPKRELYSTKGKKAASCSLTLLCILIDKVHVTDRQVLRVCVRCRFFGIFRMERYDPCISPPTHQMHEGWEKYM